MLLISLDPFPPPSGEGEAPLINEQPMDTEDYLAGQEKVDTFPDTTDIEPVADEPPLTNEATDLGGAGGVAWDQYPGKALLLNRVCSCRLHSPPMTLLCVCVCVCVCV